MEKSLKGLIHFLKDKEKIILGRGTHTDVVNDHTSVSGEHAEITYENGEYFVRDLNSSTGTFLNGKEVKGKVKFTKDDTLFIGLHAYTLHDAPRDLRDEHAISATSIEKIFDNGKVGLHKMSVHIANNEFVAMMGPSGCGKSTLLKALNNNNPATSGSVKIFGHDIRTHYDMLKRKIGYVPQDDIVHMELSVEQSLYYAAKLRLPADISETEIKERINEVLESLNINNKEIRKNRISELSGGQRKRISIAVELLHKPPILFLDEPTSPLDPESVEEFLKCLKRLNEAGTTIVMVTHKPEDLNFAQKVIFMASNGYHVYYGDPKDFLSYFNKQRIIEVYSNMDDENSARSFYKKWYEGQKKETDAEKEQTIKREKHESLLRQYFWLSVRYLNIKMNDRFNLLLLLAQPFVIGGLVTFIFGYFSLGIIFFMALSAVWFGVSNAAKEIVSEIPIYKRERMFNINITTYILSKITVLSLIALVQVIIFVLIIYFRYANQINHLSTVPQYIGFMFYLSISATILGLLLSAIFNTAEKVMTVVPMILMPQVMLSGVVTKIDSVPKELLSYLTLARWGTQGFATFQDSHYNLTDSTGSVLQLYPKVKMKMDTVEDIFNTYIIATPEVTKGDTLKSVSAMKTLAFYDTNREHLLRLFKTIPENMLVIMAMNVVSFFLLWFFLYRRDAQ